MRKTSILLLLITLAIGCQQEKQSIRIVDLPDTSGDNRHYVSSRIPLKPYPLVALPVGSVQAGGWLQTQLDLMCEGYTGHLTEISPFLTEDSGWLGGNERGWEEAPYWFRGLYDLSVLTDDKRIDSIAGRWIEAVLNSQDGDGYYGAEYNKMVVSKNGDSKLTDVWPHMVMNDVLISHYESTGDNRVIELMKGLFTYCHALPDEMFLPRLSWDYYENYREHFGDWKPRIQFKRAGDFIPQIYWLYNHTGEEWLLDFALKVYQKTQPEMNQWLDNHVVHFMQRFRYPAQIYPLTGDTSDLDRSDFFYDQMMHTWGQMPRGVFAADERIRAGKVDPRQGFESCAIVEGNKSFYILGEITGQTRFADRVEDLTFNWLPACHTPDLKALRYIFAANMVASIPQMDFNNNGSHPVFAASMHRCCQHNTAMGWPWFTKNMWKASRDNGLVAWLYGPNEVKAKVGKTGTEIRITSSTNYPFSDEIHYHVQTERLVSFPLYLRIPGWADNLDVILNGERSKIEEQQGRYVRIEREWINDDEVTIRFQPRVQLKKWPRSKSVSVDRGPITYSVRIKENWIKTDTDEFGWDKWEVLPASEWNYGIYVDKLDPEKDIRVKVSEEIAEQPWTEENSVIVLEVPVRKIPGWKASVQNTVDPLREGPVRSDEPTQWIEMIPMGAAHLRLTCLPVISDSRHARYWEDIPDPNVYMFNRLTQ